MSFTTVCYECYLRTGFLKYYFLLTGNKDILISDYISCCARCESVSTNIYLERGIKLHPFLEIDTEIVKTWKKKMEKPENLELLF